MMMNVRVLTACVCTVLLLNACGSSPPVRFYTLEPLSTGAGSETSSTTLGIGPLRFPEYLKRPQIVSTGSDGEVIIAEFDRWADTAEADFQRTLTQNLNTLLNDTMVIEFPFGGGLIHPEYRLVAQISQFTTDADGTATLDINWGIIGADDAQIIPAQRSVFTAPAESGSSYTARVEALNQTLRNLSQQIAGMYRSATQ